MSFFSVDEILKSDTEANDRINTLRKKKRKLGIELEVLKEFYAQHDVKVRQELAKEKLKILSTFYLKFSCFILYPSLKMKFFNHT